MNAKSDYLISSDCRITINPSFSESFKNWINPPEFLNKPVKIATDFFTKYCWPRNFIPRADHWTITVTTT